MSAPAAARAPQFSWKAILPKHGGYGFMPSTYSLLFPVFSPLELKILYLILENTCAKFGGDADEYMRMSQPQFAARSGIADLQSVADALDVLELSGAIRSRCPKCGTACGMKAHRVEYRPMVENFRSIAKNSQRLLPPRLQRKAEKDTAAGWLNKKALVDRARKALTDHDCSLAKEIIEAGKASPEKGEQKANTKKVKSMKTKDDSEPNTRVQPGVEITPVVTDEQFRRYIGFFAAATRPMHQSDVNAAGEIWSTLDTAQRLSAMKHGFELCKNTEDPKYIPLPQNHLTKVQKGLIRDALPERVLGPDKRSKRERAHDRAVEKFLQEAKAGKI